jgi:hypothetical protein
MAKDVTERRPNEPARLCAQRGADRVCCDGKEGIISHSYADRNGRGGNWRRLS